MADLHPHDLLPKPSVKGYVAPIIAAFTFLICMMFITSSNVFLKQEYALMVFLVTSLPLSFIFIKLNRYLSGIMGIQSGYIATLSFGLSFIILCSALLTLSLFALNALLDNSPPQKTSVTIIDKDWQGSLGNRLFRKYYVYFTLPPSINFPFYFSSSERVRISGNEYMHSTPNVTQMHLSLHKGFFGIPYYSDYSFDSSTSSTPPQPAYNPEALIACKWTKRFNLGKEIEPIEPDNYIRDFWPNGAPRSVEPTVKGLRHGIARYTFENGLLKADMPWKHGEKHGVFKIYRDDGTLEQVSSYKNGQLYGVQEWYDSKGILSHSELHTIDGQIKTPSFCANRRSH